ncbi:MAG: MlaD family protein, partial [Pirellulales bacterium]|nr:MlaD family protein [Pirellulales bacterium]
GSKYIAVLPGHSAKQQLEFEGLGDRPPGELGQNGIEIILRGQDRYGISPGAPVTWRGVEVGQVISSSLSVDAVHVDTRIRILDSHRRLLSRNSKFWATSGLQLGFGVMKGLQVSTGTLDTLARGGVSFITPGGVESDDRVRPGDMFTLHAEVDPKWVEASEPLNLLRQVTPPVVSVEAHWRQKHLGISRRHSRDAAGLIVDRGPASAVVVPRHLLELPTTNLEGVAELKLRIGDDFETTLNWPEIKEPSTEPLVWIDVTLDQAQQAWAVSSEKLRVPDELEDCFVIRRATKPESGSVTLVETLGQHELTSRDGQWQITSGRLDDESWQGATVISATDEKVVGMLVVGRRGAAIAP